jgi:hypothetical protein
VTEADLLSAARVVSIGADVAKRAAGPAAAVERWDDIPPISASYSQARQALLLRIDVLLRGMEQVP